MAETSYPYRDQEITDAQYSDFARDYAPSGVIKRTDAGTDLQVTANSTGMEVSVAAGRANLRGHRYRNSQTKKLTIEEKSAYPRIDTVVVRSEYGSAKSARLVVKKGTPTVPPTAPVAPDIEQTEEGIWEEALCDVPVSASTVTIAQSTLKDRRRLYAPAELPPIMHVGVGRFGATYDGVSRLIMKTGSVVVKCDVNSAGAFTWPRGAFPHGLISVTLTSGDNTVQTPMLEVAGGTDLSRCIIVARRPGGGGVGANLVRIEYIAWGW